jgi:uncharacterized protein (PEP-CTERM system associated)
VLTTLTPNANAVTTKWTVQPELTATETYSDNALFTSSSARGDFTTQVTPGVRIEGSGARFNANLSYAPSALFYRRNPKEDRVANVLHAFGSLEVLEKLLFVDVNGNINQNFISPFRAQPAEITSVTPNRTETRTYGISPHLTGQAGSAFSYELRNLNMWTSATNEALPDTLLRQWTGTIASPKGIVGWALQYDDSQISYDKLNSRLEQNSTLYRGRVFFEPEPEVRLSVSAGGENNNYSRQQDRRHYNLYGAGLSWRPSGRTSAEFEWERRFFGVSRLARLTHRTRLTAWSFAYSRNASSYQQELLRASPGNTVALLDAIFAARIPDPIERRAAVQQFVRSTRIPAFLANPLSFYTQQIFLEERMEASAAILGKRNFATLTVFRSAATSLSDNVNLLPSDAFLLGKRITQYGLGLNVNHHVTAFTSVGANAQRTYTRREDPSTDTSRNDYLALNLSKSLSPKTTAFGGFSISHFRSTTSDDVAAKSVFAGMSHRF